MDILDKKTIDQLVTIVTKLEDSINIATIFGAEVEQPATLDAVYVHMLSKILKELLIKNNKCILFNKEDVKKISIIKNSTLLRNIDYRDTNDSIRNFYFLPQPLVSVDKNYFKFQTNESINQLGIKQLARQFGFIDGQILVGNK